MKRFAAVLTTAVVLVGSTQVSFAATDKAKLADRLNSASQAIRAIMATPDKGIPQNILAGASCVVVVPAYKKLAFIFGGQYGQGVATCRSAKGWSAPVFVQLAGGSFGFQIGGQSTDLVLIAMNDQGLQHMLEAKFKIGGDVAAAAGPVGRNAQAGTDWKLNAQFLSYSRSKGLFAGIDLNGTTLTQNEEDTRTVYGANVAYTTVLQGSVPTPVEARPFVRTVARYFHEAKVATK